MFEKCPDNPYIIVLSFYKNVILNLKETSVLSIQYLQLDSYILTNYFKDEKTKSYSLTNEPIYLMKYHLLKNVDEFLLIYDDYEDQNLGINNDITNEDGIILINERKLLNSNI